ncbi:hypothetical protein SeMB42_g04000 [Synchytrium endobioticum]|uniref:Guanylate cyclase domain-containing protein n=1 Tax=Synchytrium endobioticum TaxID=286115 RepID=A0A507D1Z3_9FUNG|nr:hypothetical protein SeMB42_g04000 [Synchytrium endobioticum]
MDRCTGKTAAGGMAPVRVRRPGPLRAGGLHRQGARFVCYGAHGCRVIIYLQNDEPGVEHTIAFSGDPDDAEHRAVISKRDNGYTMRVTRSGVRVNSRLVETNQCRVLKHGDTIGIACCELTFYDSGEHLARQNAVASLHASDLSARMRRGSNGLGLESQSSRAPSDETHNHAATVLQEIEVDVDAATALPVFASLSVPHRFRADYEKLRWLCELSMTSARYGITEFLEKSLEVMVDVFAVDRGAVLLIDCITGALFTHSVRIRPGRDLESPQILQSPGILSKVLDSRKALVTRAFAENVNDHADTSSKRASPGIVMHVPLIAHDKVHGILILDGADSVEDLASSENITFIKTVCSLTALVIENRYLLEEVQRRSLFGDALARFVSPNVLLHLKERGGKYYVPHGGREIIATKLFVDIRGFTNLAEQTPAVEVMELLNEYFESLTHVVASYDGVVDKFLGDALLAVFGSLPEETDAELRAICAGLEFSPSLAEMNAHRVHEHKTPISIGVGIHTGKCVVGVIGCSLRLDYTVVGDAVNTSSRLSAMAGSNQVLISEATFERVKGIANVRDLGKYKLRGKTNETNVYEVLNVPGTCLRRAWK